MTVQISLVYDNKSSVERTGTMWDPTKRCRRTEKRAKIMMRVRIRWDKQTAVKPYNNLSFHQKTQLNPRKIQIYPRDELTQHWNRALRKEKVFFYFDYYVCIKYESINCSY